ncbi:MAG: hypothetical protein OES09_17715, partial [Gammaproteobacteria bacterium]|nr:hypothetical protein [Gammaproteobacteria bacterium]
DARYASDYGLCIYLLKMREYYRWEHRIPLDTPLSNQEVGDWMERKEAAWQALANQPFHDLGLSATAYDPFDAPRINEVLAESGLVYGGGIGRFAKPHFFVAQLIDREQLEGYSVWVAGEEYARELVAPPAMIQGDAIYVRKESLRRMLFEHLEEWRWNRGQHALTRVFEHYDVDRDSAAALERMTNQEMETLILHEIGELIAAKMIGGQWSDMMLSIVRTKAEIMSRAVKDHLADCVCVLPALLDGYNTPSLHFYFANLGTLRKELFPMLSGAYKTWIADGDTQSLKSAVRAGKDHWLAVAEQILEIHHAYGNDSPSRIETLVKDSGL